MDTSSNNCDTDIFYRLCRDSGTLDFWDDPAEDIYTFDDGEPINED